MHGGEQGARASPRWLVEPILECSSSGVPCQWGASFLAASADTAHVRAGAEMDRIPVQTDQFRHAQAGLGCEHQQGVIAAAEPRRPAGSGKERFDLRTRQEMHLALVVSLVWYRKHALDKGALGRLLEGHEPEELRCTAWPSPGLTQASKAVVRAQELASSPRAGSSSTCCRPRPRTARCARSATRCTRHDSRCTATWQASTSRSRRWTARSSPSLPRRPSQTTRANVVLVGGPGTGKTHLATAIGLSGITRHGKRVRFHSAVDPVNALEQERTQGKAGPIAAHGLLGRGSIRDA
ncbi:IstB-like ATP binding protein [Pseudorhodoferax soli]|uniref:IstB-like ATP binding protein n=1 Tax=Pseudorhodoferax soli TaxID=545864 RepID=A0A368X5J3_9BURK|nr:IstB-like ATP binding protein [Pseudorhodoferax soli]